MDAATHRASTDTPPPAHEPDAARARLDAALAAARAALADQQDKEGGWTASTTADSTWQAAVDILVHHLLDAVDPVRTAGQRAWIAVRQNDDGGFARRADGPSDLSCTVLAHAALQLVGHTEDGELLDRAARFVRRHGGIDAADAEPARFWLAFTGAVPWDRTVPLPPELLLLPAWTSDAGPGPTARAVAAAVGVLGSVRPVRELRFDTAPLTVTDSTRPALRAVAATAALRTAHVLARRSPGPLRRTALREAEHLLLDGQDGEETGGGDPVATAVRALALWALGHGTRHPAVGAALRPADGDGVPRVPARSSTAGDTALVLRALAAAGDRAGSDPVVDRAVDRLLPHRTYPTTGTGAGPDSPAYAPDLNGTPDPDGTALVLTALDRVGAPRSRETDTVVAAGVRRLLARQAAHGGRSGHGVRRRFPPGGRALARAGFLTPASPVVTAHVVEALCAEGYAWHPVVRRAVRLLLADQAVEGFWEDHRHGRPYATTQVLLALDAAGVGAGHLAVEGAMEWLYQRQHADGGWADEAPGTAGRAHGRGTVTQTARCVVAAHTTGVLDAPRVAAAVDFLLRRQGEAGCWATPAGRPPGGTHPPADVRATAYALWAIALHARHTASAQRTKSVREDAPTDPGGPGQPTATPARQEGRR
ncbi:prenyltransferase/squalene oxidase repeat-containing protein [Streptomyces sp. NPDC017086]|uniref:prenyltransferase/squalene oxidase repeat-containing protein n=1 Tax=Streptomyces sp. NPDC017086 TaxID=3364976 RepID=UPI0037A148F1